MPKFPENPKALEAMHFIVLAFGFASVLQIGQIYDIGKKEGEYETRFEQGNLYRFMGSMFFEWFRHWTYEPYIHP